MNCMIPEGMTQAADPELGEGGEEEWAAHGMEAVVEH